MTALPSLAGLGWGQPWQESFRSFADQGLAPARVISEHRGAYRIRDEQRELWGEISGALRHRARSRADYPVVGDWVAIRPLTDQDRGVIHAVMPRKSKFSRKVAGNIADEQVVSANVDTVLLMMGLDNDFSPRRLERYLVMAWESGARPVVVLNKADLCEDVGSRVAEIEQSTLGVQVHVISCRRGDNLETVGQFLGEGQTVALLGSSGVGKSTLINHLVGREVMQTAEVRERDQRGRHTTVHRQLLPLPGGGAVIDNPGMRELQLWDADDGVQESFEDVETLARECRYANCAHETEPGCGIQEGLAEGRLTLGRLESYRTVRRELTHLAARVDRVAQQENKRRVKELTRAFNAQQPRS